MGESLTARAQRLGIPRSTLWEREQKRLYADIRRDAALTNALPDPDPNPDKFLSQVEQWSKTLTEQRTQTNSVSIAIPSKKPIALAFTGDWHFGALGTDYGLLYQDVQKLAQAQELGVYCVGMGDYGDNYKTNMGSASNGLYDAVVPSPDDQQRGWYRLLEKLRPNLLALILGCHLDWDFNKAGRDVLQSVCEQLGDNSLGSKVANFGYGGVLRLAVGDQEYTALCRHRVSSDDGTPQRKMERDYPEDEDWDVIAVGHLHYPDLRQVNVRGREQVWLRSGAYKVVDRYGQKLAGYKGIPGVPLVILWPDKKKMLAFRGEQLSDGLAVLKAIRDGSLKL